MKSALQTQYPFMIQQKEQSITFRSVSFAKDFERLYKWMHEPHVIPYWNLNISKQAYEQHLKTFLADSHQKLLIGEIDGVPMSYWESYMVEGDIISNYYPYEKGDQGIHLLIGEPDFLGKGYIYPLLLSLLKHKFEVADTAKVIAEPDRRNEKMIAVFKKCGFQFMKEVSLPDKTGVLLKCEREVFERRWSEWNNGTF
ncbi:MULTISPECIES: GNAT family N-acetyltransferase [Priestia]|uniref:GNAT family N-acetyltransferase n=1 Tax=Priestia TaxID=2800373 RepID=UPI0027A0D5EE|nr:MULTISPECIES: GNAT family N-acetyltransferase [Priestia]MED3953734.1 GNAT family N-acetyltransferase [Priestia aryabhattai]WDC87378.1 GNAT family N-acetyltransferase [Priestia megaterium]